MSLKIGSRKSDLARIQAYAVGAALRRQDIEYVFKASFGDQNLDRPLHEMPEKGVFTKDLTDDLLSGKFDMVVHSWKDLPTDQHPDTMIAATLPRADRRDLLLVKREHVERIRESGQIKILSSSPRRAYNLKTLLAWALPFGDLDIQFSDIRGNIPTRLTRFFENENADGLVLAKAAVDRLLSAEREEFAAARARIRQSLDKSLFMILPMRECPSAAAQGALAVEIKKSRQDLMQILAGINCDQTYDCVVRERNFLASKGGGCHQKIGVTFYPHPHGLIFSARGKTDDGETILDWKFVSPAQIPGEMVEFFPKTSVEGKLLKYDSVHYDQERILSEKYVWLAKVTAWPKELPPSLDRVLWVSGSESWKKMAKDGHWVNGSSEGLGNAVSPQIETMQGRPVPWVKLTHIGAVSHSEMAALGTYALKSDKERMYELDHVTHFFWNSYSNFEEAVMRYPSIRHKQHACGPGQSVELIREALGPDSDRLQIFISYDEWRAQLPRKKV